MGTRPYGFGPSMVILAGSGCFISGSKSVNKLAKRISQEPKKKKFCVYYVYINFNLLNLIALSFNVEKQNAEN